MLIPSCQLSVTQRTTRYRTVQVAIAECSLPKIQHQIPLCFIPPKRVRLIVLGFNNTSTLMGHFVSSPREREKRDRRDSRGDEREGQGRKRKINKSEETEKIKTFSLYLYLLQEQQALPVSQSQMDAPVT